MADKSTSGCPHFLQTTPRAWGRTDHSDRIICVLLLRESASMFNLPGMYLAWIWHCIQSNTSHSSQTSSVNDHDFIPPCLLISEIVLTLSGQIRITYSKSRLLPSGLRGAPCCWSATGLPMLTKFLTICDSPDTPRTLPDLHL